MLVVRVFRWYNHGMEENKSGRRRSGKRRWKRIIQRWRHQGLFRVAILVLLGIVALICLFCFLNSINNNNPMIENMFPPE